jgi:benzoate/toluate 1,2-dioxygenase beta subunit
MSTTLFAPARGETSEWLTNAWYEQMLAETSFGRGRPDAAEHAEAVRDLLLHEARLLDERRHAEWLDLFAAQCVYWFAAGPAPYDPRLRVSVTLDDRRRLTDRLARLASGTAYSQIPPSRTQHLLSFPEVWHLPGARLLVRSGFTLLESRDDISTLFGGAVEHVLEPEEGGWLIGQKRIFLTNADRMLPNVSFIF